MKRLVQKIKMSAKKVIKQFECSDCDKVFTDKSNLSKHKKSIHQGLTYNCDRCDQTFAYSQGLQRHKRSVHEGERFECKICQKTFSQAENLSRHKRSVHEGLRFECQICKKTFSQKPHLNDHILTVHGQKCYKCDLCNDVFKHRNGLYRHKQRNHLDRKVHLKIYEVKQETPDEDLLEEKEIPKAVSECKICGLSFASYKILHMHEIMVHQDQ